MTRLSLFQYSKFRIFEISSVLHLVVPSFDSHPTVEQKYISDISTELGKGNMSDVHERRQYGTVS